MSERKIIAGIDPGVKTGLATWKPEVKRFIEVRTCSLLEAFEVLHQYRSDLSEIWFEDARQRTWFEYPKDSPETIARLQGVGSIKRDSAIWQEFCEFHKIPFKAIKPAKGQTKWSSEYFKRLTGWTGRTSQHARDAAILVFGAK